MSYLDDLLSQNDQQEALRLYHQQNGHQPQQQPQPQPQQQVDPTYAYYMGTGQQQEQPTTPQNEGGIFNGFFRGAKSGGAGVIGGQAGLGNLYGVGDGSTAKWAEEVAQNNARRKEYSIPEMLPFASDYWTNGEGAAYDLGNALGSSAVLGAETAAVMSGAGAVAGALGIGTTGLAGAIAAGSRGAIGMQQATKMVASMGAGQRAAALGQYAVESVAGRMADKASAMGLNTLSKVLKGPAGKLYALNILRTPFEVSSEMGNAGQDALKDGQSVDEARKRAWITGAVQTPLLAFSNTLETGNLGKILMGDAKKVGGTQKLISALGGITMEAFQNAWEEGMQQSSQEYAADKQSLLGVVNPFQWSPEAKGEAAAGFVSGLGIGGGSAAMNSFSKDTNKKQTVDTPADPQQARDFLTQFAQTNNLSAEEQDAITGLVATGSNEEIINAAQGYGWNPAPQEGEKTTEEQPKTNTPEDIVRSALEDKSIDEKKRGYYRNALDRQAEQQAQVDALKEELNGMINAIKEKNPDIKKKALATEIKKVKESKEYKDKESNLKKLEEKLKKTTEDIGKMSKRITQARRSAEIGAMQNTQTEYGDNPSNETPSIVQSTIEESDNLGNKVKTNVPLVSQEERVQAANDATILEDVPMPYEKTPASQEAPKNGNWQDKVHQTVKNNQLNNTVDKLNAENKKEQEADAVKAQEQQAKDMQDADAKLQNEMFEQEQEIERSRNQSAKQEELKAKANPVAQSPKEAMLWDKWNREIENGKLPAPTKDQVGSYMRYKTYRENQGNPVPSVAAVEQKVNQEQTAKEADKMQLANDKEQANDTQERQASEQARIDARDKAVTQAKKDKGYYAPRSQAEQDLWSKWDNQIKNGKEPDFSSNKESADRYKKYSTTYQNSLRDSLAPQNKQEQTTYKRWSDQLKKGKKPTVTANEKALYERFQKYRALKGEDNGNNKKNSNQVQAVPVQHKQSQATKQTKTDNKGKGANGKTEKVSNTEFSIGNENNKADNSEIIGQHPFVVMLRKLGYKVVIDKKTWDGYVQEAVNRGDLETLEQGNLIYGAFDPKTNTINLNPYDINLDTPIHEYTHLWVKLIQKSNPKLWAKGKELLKQLKTWNAVVNDPHYQSYKKNLEDGVWTKEQYEDKIASEVMSRVSGLRGVYRMKEMMDNLAKAGESKGLIQKVIDWIGKFFHSTQKQIAPTEDLANMSVWEFINMPVNDVFKGVTYNEASAKAKNNSVENTYSTENQIAEFQVTSGTYFSGGGLVDYALKSIIDGQFAVEKDPKIAGVYKLNNDNHMFNDDVRDFDPSKYKGKVDYFHASPVCKNFSGANNKGGEQPLDIMTAKAVVKALEEIRPKAFTLENVHGYHDSEAMNLIVEALDRLSYNHDNPADSTYNSADFGAATSRDRIMLRAIRKDVGELPAKPKGDSKNAQSWDDALKEAGLDINKLPEKPFAPGGSLIKSLQKKLGDLRKIDKPFLVMDTMSTGPRMAFAGKPAPTILAKGGEQRIFIPKLDKDGKPTGEYDVREASPRVMAILQGLKDYKFPDGRTKTLSYRVVGNGVPVKLTQSVFGPLLKQIDEDGGKNAEFQVAGKKSATADISKMHDAIKMLKAGNNPKTVYDKTGWYIGADKKLKYEIPDKAELIRLDKIKLDEPVPLKDVYPHPELLKAYPFLRDVKIVGTDIQEGSSGSDGIKIPIKNITELMTSFREVYGEDFFGNANYMDDEDNFLKAILVHEVQHQIQDYEGFAEGDNGSNAVLYLLDKNLEKIYEMEKEYPDIKKLHEAYEGLKYQREKLKRNLNEKDRAASEKYVKEFEDSIEKYKVDISKSAYDEYKNLKNRHSGFASGGTEELFDEILKTYMNISGEKEARATSQKMFLNPNSDDYWNIVDSIAREPNPIIVFNRNIKRNIKDDYLDEAEFQIGKQAESIREKYKDTDKWMKAPNGKSTNLTEEQWCQVRTKNFKDWFGDWEAAKDKSKFALDENGEPLVLYHGTGRYGFETFDNNIGTKLIYVTPNARAAKTYTASFTAQKREMVDDYIDAPASDIDALIKNAKTVLGVNYEIPSRKFVDDIRQKTLKSAKKWDKKIMDADTSYGVPYLEDESTEEYRQLQDDHWTVFGFMENLLENDEWLFDENGNSNVKNYRFYLKNYVDNIEEARDRLKSFYRTHKDDFSEDGQALMHILVEDYNFMDAVYDAIYQYARLASGEKVLVANVNEPSPVVVQADKLAATVWDASKKGIYSLYAKLGNNPLIIDAKGGHWTNVEAKDVSEHRTSTDRVGRLAKEKGYTSVVVKNVVDPHGTYGINDEIDDYILFEPNQVKSATNNNGDFSLDDDSIEFLIAYHGTPYKFDKFSTQKVLSGEGAMVHGWGAYFALDKSVSDGYAKKLAKTVNTFYLDGKELDLNNLNDEEHKVVQQVNLYGSIDKAIEKIKNDIEKAKKGNLGLWVSPKLYKGMPQEEKKRIRIQGFLKELDVLEKYKDRITNDSYEGSFLYTVDIPDADKMVNEDATFKEQPKSVQKAVLEILNDISENKSAKQLVDEFAKEYPSVNSERDIPPYIMSEYELKQLVREMELIGLDDKEGKYDLEHYDEYVAKQKAKPHGKGTPIKDIILDIVSNGYHSDDIQEQVVGLLKHIPELSPEGYAYPLKQLGRKLQARYYLDDNDSIKSMTGRDIYTYLSEALGGYDHGKQASLALNKQGIKGILYDGSSDGPCAVIFDDKAIKILSRYDLVNNVTTSEFSIDSPAFKKWFGNSKLVDKNGKPQVFYRGINRQYDVNKQNNVVWITDNKEQAEDYATYAIYNTENGEVLDVYARVENPIDLGDSWDEWSVDDITEKKLIPAVNKALKDGRITEEQATDIRKDIDNLESKKFYNYEERPLFEIYNDVDGFVPILKKLGYDAIKVTEGNNQTYGVFGKSHVKSATNNNGNYDINNDHIEFSIKDTTDLAGKFTPEQIDVIDKYLSESGENQRLAKLLKDPNLKDTPWARQSYHAIVWRMAARELMAGREPKFNNTLSGSKKIHDLLKSKGVDGALEYILQTKDGFIGHAEKPKNAVNASFLNCNPSSECAKFCYAATGRNYANILNKQELVNMLVEEYPQRAAEEVVNQYKALPEYYAKKALRILDRGDISEKWLPFIKEVNKQGVRLQIFSKRAELLSQIDKMNVVMLSVDSSNFDLADKYKDLPLAFVWRGAEDNERLEQERERFEKLGGVILPVKLGHSILSKDKVDNLPKWASRFACPIDKGVKKIGEWNCTMCDKNGGVGCFFGKVTSKVMEELANIDNISSDSVENIIKEKLNEIAKEFEARGGEVDERERQELFKRLVAIYERSLERNANGTNQEKDRTDGETSSRGRQEQAELQVVYHGTKAKFDKFTLDHLLSGEGAMVHGWGLYFAKDRLVGEEYRDKLSYDENESNKNTSQESVENTYSIDGKKYVAKRNAKYSDIDNSVESVDISIKDENGYDLPNSILKDIVTELSEGYKLDDLISIHKYRLETAKKYPANGLGKNYAFRNIAKEEAILEWIEKHKKDLKAVNSIQSSRKPIEKVGRLLKVEIPEDSEMIKENGTYEEQPKVVKDMVKALRIDASKVNFDADIGDVENAFMDKCWELNVDGLEDEFADVISVSKERGAIEKAIANRDKERALQLIDKATRKQLQEVLSDDFGMRDDYRRMNAIIDKLYRAAVVEGMRPIAGAKLYNYIRHSDRFESDKEMSAWMTTHGVKGITYDGRDDGPCVVVWDDNAIKILERYDIDNNPVEFSIRNTQTSPGTDADMSSVAGALSRPETSTIKGWVEEGKERVKEAKDTRSLDPLAKGSRFREKWIDKYDTISIFDKAILAAQNEMFLKQGKEMLKELPTSEQFKNRVTMLTNAVGGMQHCLLDGNYREMIIAADHYKLPTKNIVSIDGNKSHVSMQMIIDFLNNNIEDIQGFMDACGNENVIQALDTLVSSEGVLEDYQNYLKKHAQWEHSNKKEEEPTYTFPEGTDKAKFEKVVAKAPMALKQAADMYYKFNNDLIHILRHAGVISEKELKTYEHKYKKFCPLMRDFSDTEALDSYIRDVFGGGGVANVTNPLKHRSGKGSSRNILSPVGSTAVAIRAYITRAERNMLAQDIVKTAKQYNLTTLIAPAKPKAKVGPEESVIGVMVDGKKELYEVDRALYGPLTNCFAPTVKCDIYLAKLAAQTLRVGATTSPGFIIRNFLRDTLTASMMSHYNFIPVVDSLRGAMKLLTDKDFRARFEASGIVNSTQFHSRKDAEKKFLEATNGQSKEYGLVDYLNAIRKYVWGKYSGLNELVEASTRAGLMLKAEEAGATPSQAAYEAIYGTVNFNRSGTAGQQVNKVIPFFNAVIQGGDLLYQEIKRDPKGMAFKIGTKIILPSLVLWLANSDEDWYKELDPNIKMNYWCLPNGVRIQKAEAAVIFGSGIEAMMDEASGKDPKSMKHLKKALWDVFMPNFIPTVMLPLIEWQANYSFFRGKPVVNSAMQKLPDELQYGPYTPAGAIWAGKALGQSPDKIYNLWRSITGTMGTFLLQGTDLLDSAKDNLPEKQFSEKPIARDFLLNPNNYNRSISDFFELYDAANKQHRANGVSGKPTKEISEIQKVHRMISKAYSERKKIEADTKLSSTQKRAKTDKIDKDIKRMARSAVDKYGKQFDIT